MSDYIALKKGDTLVISCAVSAVRQEPVITWSGGTFTNQVDSEFVSKAKDSKITVTGTDDAVYTCLMKFKLNDIVLTTNLDVICALCFIMASYR